jgi:hypothetical protein
LDAIPQGQRAEYLLQQRMHFELTIETPHGMIQAEIRILYLWPDAGILTPALSLVRLGKGKMMGWTIIRNQQWVGASAAFSRLRIVSTQVVNHAEEPLRQQVE